MMMIWQKDLRNSPDWFGHYYHDKDYITVVINEPLIEKTKSHKAEARVESIHHNRNSIAGKGNLLLYFAKDSFASQLKYGDKILVTKKLQPINNSGNPGAFNYQQFTAFQQIFHTTYLKPGEWVLMKDKKVNKFRQFLYNTRSAILSVIRTNVNSDKDALGIAQALLIGYTNDLDKDLVQAYSNTGVVHIIAISGMHLGLIYVLLAWIFKRIPLIKRSGFVQMVIIICSLWLFALLTGAAPSVLRAAVMFTFIAAGKLFFKTASVYNSLAASAFVLLCYNPYFLWSVGFQLSYLAVLGIVVFQRPIYKLVYIRNRWVDKIWQMGTVTLAAQVLTFPVCIYYFHQFPGLFLPVNIIVVPMAGFILYAEIILLGFSWFPFAAGVCGWIITWMLKLMNAFIHYVNKLPFAVWDNIQATALSTCILYAVVMGISYWLFNKSKTALRFSLFCLLGFSMLMCHTKWKQKNQQQLIIYNVPQHRAIDIIKGNDYLFIGDSILMGQGAPGNFHLKPARTARQLNKRVDVLPGLFEQSFFYQFGEKKIALIQKEFEMKPQKQKIDLDVILISKNANIRISQLAAVFNCRLFVFDASNSLWKIDKWQKECETLHLQGYSIPEKGAFVTEL